MALKSLQKHDYSVSTYSSQNGVEHAAFDENLFGFKVGRLELEDSDVEQVALGDSILLDDLRLAHSDNYNLVYLMSPNYNPRGQTLLHDLESSLLGINVDYKTTYRAPLEFFSKHQLQSQLSKSVVNIVSHPFDPSLDTQPLSPELRTLALVSGEYSRFKADSRVPASVYDQLFTAWIHGYRIALIVH